MTLEQELQTLALDTTEDRLSVILILASPSDADGIRSYSERLPITLLRGILDPNVADFFIPIEGSARLKPPRAKSHWLHTSQIREIVLLDELPDEA